MTPLSLDRLHELASNDSDVAPSEVEIHGLKYIRSEYFYDGQRKFFSPIDFAMNGPEEGSVMERDDKQYGHCKVKILKKHYEHGSEVPSFIECEVRKRSRIHKLWVVVRLTALVKKKFCFRNLGDPFSSNYALYPDIFLKRKLSMDLMSPHNDASIAFSIVTGIPATLRVREDFV